jgi:xanthosine utilization system XapX-like protein
VTFTVPAVAMSVAGTLTVICVDVCVTGVSAGFVPKLTVELAIKFVPVRVRVNAAPPAVALVGLMEVRVGAGFAAALTVKFAAADVPPPGVGFVTVTGNVPAVAISAAVIAAVT